MGTPPIQEDQGYDEEEEEEGGGWGDSSPAARTGADQANLKSRMTRKARGSMLRDGSSWGKFREEAKARHARSKARKERGQASARKESSPRTRGSTSLVAEYIKAPPGVAPRRSISQATLTHAQLREALEEGGSPPSARSRSRGKAPGSRQRGGGGAPPVRHEGGPIAPVTPPPSSRRCPPLAN